MPGDTESVRNDDADGPAYGDETPTLQTTLNRHFIDVCDIPLRQISLSAFSRQLNEEGLDVVTRSIKDKGWLPHACPVVVVHRESLPNGEFTRDCLDTAEYIVVDGNHRQVNVMDWACKLLYLSSVG